VGCQVWVGFYLYLRSVLVWHIKTQPIIGLIKETTWKT